MSTSQIPPIPLPTEVNEAGERDLNWLELLKKQELDKMKKRHEAVNPTVTASVLEEITLTGNLLAFERELAKLPDLLPQLDEELRGTSAWRTREDLRQSAKTELCDLFKAHPAVSEFYLEYYGFSVSDLVNAK